jgi:uncharacterized protein
MNQFLRNLSPLSQIAFSVAFSFISVILFSVVATFLSAMWFGYSIEELSTNFDFFAHENLQVIVLFTMLNAIGMFLLPALTCASFFSSQPYSYLHLNVPPKWLVWVFSLALLVLSFPVINFTNALNALIELPQWMADEEAKRELLITWILTDHNLLQNLLLLAIIPAFSEELFFRGLLQKLFTKAFKGRTHLAVILLAFVFSAMHLQFAGFIPRFFMGLVLGYVYVYSGSLWPGIVIHFLNNAIGVTLGMMALNNPDINAIDDFGSELTLLNGSIAVAALAGIVLVFMRLKRLRLATV